MENAPSQRLYTIESKIERIREEIFKKNNKYSTVQKLKRYRWYHKNPSFPFVQTGTQF